ncbi:MAG: N-acetyltransferase [Proteobacteria bacterium]|nr:MAG: N-acetyltransferase [Pseudomonadota bacterium]
MNISYRVLRPADSTSYRNIRLEALRLNPEAYASSYEGALQMPKMFFEVAMESGSRSQWVMGAFDDEVLIGIFAYSDENSFGIPAAGTLLQMYVRESYRGKGLGQVLTVNILKEIFNSHPVEQVLLEVKDGNESAKAVYIKTGFTPLEEKQSNSNAQCLTFARRL